MCALVTFVADAGPDAGLGHVSRSSAVAVALGELGHEVRCWGNGIEAPLVRDRVEWWPLRAPLGRLPGELLILDSYRLTADEADARPLVLMNDYGGVDERACLVVGVTLTPGGDRVLGGLEYAALRPAFWEIGPRTVRPEVGTVLISTGAGGRGDFISHLSERLAAALPATRVVVVRGPYARLDAPPGVELLSAPESLLESLLEADLVVTAGGQTLLEATAAGTPAVALPLVENQRRQVELLGGAGAVRVIDPPEPEAVAATAVELAGDARARRALSERAQRLVDGRGAPRVAERIARLLT